MNCKHVTDSVLVDFYATRPALTCARCWLELADTAPPRLAHTARRTSAGRAARLRRRRDPATHLLFDGQPLRELEDRLDVEAAQKALEEPGTEPWKAVKARLCVETNQEDA